MSKKNKKNNSSLQKPLQQNKDMFDVKENLKKLRSGSGKENYETESDIQSSKSSDRYYGTNHKEVDTGYSSTSTTDRFDKINDKLNSDFSILKDNFSEHKEKIIEKLSEKVDKSELKWWISGLLGGVILISGVIYTLSYQGIIGDVKNLQESKNNIDKTIIHVDNRLNIIEKNMSNNSIETNVETENGNQK